MVISNDQKLFLTTHGDICLIFFSYALSANKKLKQTLGCFSTPTFYMLIVFPVFKEVYSSIADTLHHQKVMCRISISPLWN